jgi:hypothetical protein
MTYTCQCIQGTGCDNGSPAGSFGDVVTGVTGPNVDGLYGAHRIGSQLTGWSCAPTGQNVVACEGTTAIFACGNNAVGGSGGDLVSGVPTSQAIASGTGYGVLQTGFGDTGWNAYCSSY